MNYYENTRPALISTLPIPQRYYVPGRLRDSHRPRLEVAGLWRPHDEAGEDSRFSAFEKLARKKEAKERKEKMRRAFEKEKVCLFVTPGKEGLLTNARRLRAKLELSWIHIQGHWGT